MSRAFKTIRPIYRARPKINAEVTGRLTESLGGVRVVKGYHAEEREEKVFQAGVQRLLDNVLQTLTATSLMSVSATVLMGIVSASIMFLGAKAILSGAMTPGGFFPYLAFLGMLIAPVAQIVGIGPHDDGGPGGSRAHPRSSGRETRRIRPGANGAARSRRGPRRLRERGLRVRRRKAGTLRRQLSNRSRIQ